MKREQLAPLASLAVSLALLVAMCVLPFVPPHRAMDYPSYEATDGQTDDDVPQDAPNGLSIGDLAIIFTAAATAALAWFAFRQIRDTRRSNERQLRAYVGIHDSSIENVAVGKIPVAYVALRNAGQTPAYDFYATIGIGIGVHPWPDSLEMPNPLVNLKGGKITFEYIGVGILGPNQKAHLKQQFDKALTDIEMLSLTGKREAIYVYGTVRYRDTFNRYWCLEYRKICGGAATVEHLYGDKVTEHQSDERTHRQALALSGFSAKWPEGVPLPAGDGGVGLSGPK